MTPISYYVSQTVKRPCPVDGIPFEPLWYNSYATHNSNIFIDSVIQQLILLVITQVKHVCEIKSYELQFRWYSNR